MTLPKPYYEDAHTTIYCAKNEDILPHIGRFDLLLTDPPYGHGEKWSGGTWASNPIYEDAFEWDSKTVGIEVIDAAISKAFTSIIWGGNYYSVMPSRCWLAWVKTQQMETMADFELAWTNMDRPSKSFIAGRNPDGIRLHPTQKPVALMSWCLGFVPEAKTCLDPYGGVMTTAVACKLRGVHCTAIEQSEKYCGIGVERLRQGVLITV